VTSAFEAFVDDISNWYIRRSRRRFWDGDADALATLWWALTRALRTIAPVMPFLTDHLWRNLVGGPCPDAPPSVHLAPWPEREPWDEELVAEIADVRRVTAAGHRARQASGLKVRQPLRRLVVEGAPRAESHADEIGEELRVKDVEFGPVDAVELRVKPNLPVLGPKLGRELGTVRAALQAGDFEELADGNIRVGGHELSPDEVLVERGGREGWAVAEDHGVTVGLDTALDDELRLEGQVLDVIHQINAMRKDAGLELTDRIVVTLPTEQSDLLRHADWIKQETLAVEIRADGGTEPTIAKVER